MNVEYAVIKKYLTYVGYLLVALSLIYLGQVFADNIEALHGVPPTLINYLILVTLLVFYIFGYAIFSYSWLLQLKVKYPEFSYRSAFSIIGRSQIGKYLPGNIAQFVARLALLPKNMKKTDVMYTMFIENIVMLTTSVVVGICYIFYFDFFREIGQQRLWLGLAAFLSFSLISYFGIRLLRNKFDFLKLSQSVSVKILALSFLSPIMGGATIYLLVAIFGDTSSVTYFQCVTGFSLSFVAGFIVPGAPGGIGIREFVFVLLFGGFVTTAIALEIILTFRVLSITGDALLFALAYLIRGIKLEQRV